MAKKKERDFTFHIDQEILFDDIEIFAPLSKQHELFINDDENAIIAYGGGSASGKSHCSLLKLMIDCIEQPGYNALLARESLVQLKSPGSLWEEGSRMFDHVGVSSNQINNQWRFPNKSFIKCHFLKNNQKDYQGMQLSAAIIEEASQINSWDDIWYITSRLRGKGSKTKQLRMTFNPDRNSPLCQLIIKAGYIKDDGFPDLENCNKTKYLIQVNGEYEFYDSRKDIEDKYGENAAKAAYSFIYYTATVYDNPAIIKDQPEYLFKLENLKPVERARLLDGNFLASENAAGYVKREDFKEIELNEVPFSLPTVRSWDLAATPVDPSKSDKQGGNPDFTRGTLCSYDRDTGNFFILDMKSIRDRSALVDNLVMKTAREDSKYDAYTIITQDSGGAGKEVAETKRSKLLAQGSKPIIHKARKAKMKMAENFIIAAQEGRVHVVKGAFSAANYSELENFLGDGKNNGWHDDIMDTLSQAYSVLTTGRLIPTIKVSRNNPRLNNLFGKTVLN
ncbi:phage terminase large subunit [Vreelandella arcis]|uniref:Phage terminase large subunit n=1 Tax=Vreelandella arcis TaxID=416873 RepID=A0A1H0IZW4_9GAMM|nr:phage terminase large subunit [Halomonas arcis]SDO36986.1 Phage terminase large subunit [Halomonas arcis]